MSARFDMSLALDVQEVGRVIDRLEEFCAEEGIPAAQGLRFGLALDELITNIISYGQQKDASGEIRLAIEHKAGALVADLVDRGAPFDPVKADTEVPDGPLEQRRPGGLGLTLVKSVLDRFEYQRDGDINRLQLEMKLKAA